MTFHGKVEAVTDKRRAISSAPGPSTVGRFRSPLDPYRPAVRRLEHAPGLSRPWTTSRRVPAPAPPANPGRIGCAPRSCHEQDARQRKTPAVKGRAGTAPIMVHFPKQVRDQLKILAVQNGTTLHGLVAEAYNGETAMTETRPWIGSLVSVAQFVMLRDLSVVDCSAPEIIEWKAGAVEGELEWGSKYPDPDEWENIVWGDINRAFSQPVTRTDDVAEYAPTQVLAEAFRNAGYDGIVYGSKLGTGKNVAIFDLKVAELADCHLYRVEAVNLKFERAANSYYRYLNRKAAEKLGYYAGETKDVPPPEGQK